MVADAAPDYPSQHAAICAVAKRPGKPNGQPLDAYIRAGHSNSIASTLRGFTRTLQDYRSGESLDSSEHKLAMSFLGRNAIFCQSANGQPLVLAAGRKELGPILLHQRGR
jgi:hypothetical protein